MKTAMGYGVWAVGRSAVRVRLTASTSIWPLEFAQQTRYSAHLKAAMSSLLPTAHRPQPTALRTEVTT